MRETIETKITEFIANGAKQGVESITAEDRLLEDGIIDSLSLLDLVDFIESTYEITVDEFDIDVDTFGSVRSIANYVSAKRG
jgi:acyl carrier protein